MNYSQQSTKKPYEICDPHETLKIILYVYY